ncbi:MAG: LysR substrate-binding domain-containing protein [Betaproteobacteria bacterium]
MDTRWLEDFVLLAASGSFARAAETSNLSQAAFGRRIKALEAWVGVPLVDRSVVPLRLTAQGKVFRDAAAEALRVLDEARDTLRGADAGGWAAVRLATGRSLSLNFVPDWFERLRARDAAVEARVLTTSTEGISLLVEGAVDVLLSYWTAELRLLDEMEFEWLRLGTERLLPVSLPDVQGRPRYPLPGRAGAPLPWLRVAEATRQGQVVAARLAAHKPPANLKPVYEADFSEALADLTLRGLGLTWLPERFAAPHLASGRLARAGDDSWDAKMEIRLFRRRNNRRAPVERLWRAAAALPV